MTDENRSKTGFSPLLFWMAMLVLLLACAGLSIYYFTPERCAVWRRLSEADSKSEAALKARLDPLDKLFVKAREGANPFAEEVLSWSGKWALVRGMLGSGNGHAAYVSEAFGRHLFTPDELQEAMESSIKAYLMDLEGIEAEMLVNLRADLEGFGGSSSSPSLGSKDAFEREYQRLAGDVSRTAQVDFGMTVGREVGLLVTSEIATQAALQAARTAGAEMGVEAGVLGTGAASAVATLGIGLIIAAIIDYVLDAIFKAAGYDPQKKIAAQTCDSLDKLKKSLLHDPAWFEGGKKKGALRKQMEHLHQSRSKIRREAIAQMLKERNP